MMARDQNTLQKTLSDASDAFSGLDHIHRQLREAVEDRNYTLVDGLLAQQRAVFEQAGVNHPKARYHATVARDMAAWALTMVRLQHAHDQRQLFEVIVIQKASESYAPPSRMADYLGEG